MKKKTHTLTSLIGSILWTDHDLGWASLNVLLPCPLLTFLSSCCCSTCHMWLLFCLFPFVYTLRYIHIAIHFCIYFTFSFTLHCHCYFWKYITLHFVTCFFFPPNFVTLLPQLVRKIVLFEFFVCFVGARCFLFDFCIFAEMRLTICLFYFSSRLRVKFCSVPTKKTILPAATNLSHRPTCPVSCIKRKPQGLFPIPFVRPNVWCSDLSCLELCCSKKFIVNFFLKFWWFSFD